MAMIHRNIDLRHVCSILGATCVLVLLTCGSGPSIAQSSDAPPPESAADDAPARIPPEQLQSLVAPIALYPDDLLAQALVASTYPLEIIQLQQWLTKNPNLEGEELEAALEAQPWDPSIKSMAAIPEVVDRLANDIQWTTDLGNAFLAQQEDVLAAAQTMRKKAQQKGSLESNEQMTVETQVVERDTIIIVESADPEIIYVPSYDPVVVYPTVVYAYPPIYYPPPPPGGLFIAFSIGVRWGRYWGGPCCGCGWGRGSTNIYINNSNNFYRASNHRGGDWKHNPEHRGAAPYGDRDTADKFGGRTRDEPRDRSGDRAGDRSGDRAGDRSSDRAGDRSGDRSGDRGTGDRPATTDRSGDRSSGDRAAADRDRAGGSNEASRSRDGDRSSGSANRGESDRVGNREVQKGEHSRSGNGVGGGNHGSYDRSRAQNSHNRGQASRGASRGGGGRGGRR